MPKGNKPLLIIILIILGVLGGSYILVSFVILPSFDSWNKSKQELTTQNQRVDQIKASIANLTGLDKERITFLKAFVDTLVPDELDSFHFASLNEVVAKAANVTVTSVQISKGAGGTTTAIGKGQTNQTAPTNVTVTYSSDFDSLLTLIKYWVVADRLVGPTTIMITGQAGNPALTYTLGYQLPIAPKVTAATVEDPSLLTPSQIAKLEQLRAKVVYTATPSTKPLGKDNPFQ